MQGAIGQLQSRNAAWFFTGQPAAVGNPGGAVGGQGHGEWPVAGMMKGCDVIRVASQEDVDAVIAIAGDPDVALRVCGHPLRSERAALVTPGARDRRT